MPRYQGRQYGLVDVPQIDPMRSLSQMMYAARNMSAFQEESKARRQQAAEEKDFNTAGGDLLGTAKLREKAGDYVGAKKFKDRADQEAHATRQRKEQEFGQMLQRADALPSLYGKAGQLLDGIATPEQYAKAVPVLREWATSIHPDLAAKIPDVYDATQVAEWRRSVPVLQQKAARFADGLKQFLPGADPVKGLGLLYETADTDEEREQITAQAKYFEVPQGTITAGQTLAAQARAAAEKAQRTEARVEARAQGVDDRARVDDTRQEAARREQERHNRAMEKLQLQREARLDDQGDGASRIKPTVRAQAALDKQTDLDKLEREFADPDRQPGPMTEADLDARKLLIENRFRTRVGASALSALPAEWRSRGARATGRGTPPPNAPAWAPPPTTQSEVPRVTRQKAPRQAPQASQFKTSTAGRTVTVTAPDGSTVDFASQAEADAAIQAYLESIGQQR